MPITIDSYQVRYRNDDGYLDITVWDDDVFVARLTMYAAMFAGIKAYGIGSVGVSEAYNGKGIGKALYLGLVKLMDVSLTSTDSHSPGARKLWMKLSQEPGIQTYGFEKDPRSAGWNVFHVEPNSQKSELVGVPGSPKLYGNRQSGLIITKRGSNADRTLKKLLALSTKQQDTKADVFGVRHSQYSPLDIR